MMIAVHDRPGSFSDRWLEQCRARAIPHIAVDCHASAVVDCLKGASALLWHWTHESTTDQLIARHVIMAAELLELEVFPNTPTCWHFDDKVGQKYLLEAVGAPIARTWVFYDLQGALEFIGKSKFPLVFKLRRGAGSINVRLVRTSDDARRLAGRAFGAGFLPVGSMLADASSRLARARRRPDLAAMLRRLPRTLYRIHKAREDASRERGYIYFQEFLPGNDFDTRVTVIGERGFAFTRSVRKGDFRASGSGAIEHQPERIDLRCVRIAFDVARRIGSQSMAFDFAQGKDGEPQILEVSFAYQAKAVYDCPGHWDRTMCWHPGHLWPQDAILDDLLERLATRRPQAVAATPGTAK